MKKNQINILKDRGIISVSGKDSKEFLQNIITNDINGVNKDNSIFSGIFTPQGKYLYEFFVIKSDNGYYEEKNLSNNELKVPTFKILNLEIWGATAAVLSELIDISN